MTEEQGTIKWPNNFKTRVLLELENNEEKLIQRTHTMSSSKNSVKLEMLEAN